MASKGRLLTAAWALPLVAAAVLYLPNCWFALVIGLVAAVGQWELYRMHFKDGLPLFAWAACGVGLLTVASASSALPWMWPTLGAIVILSLRLIAARPMPTAIGEAGIAVGGVLYIAVLLSHIAQLHGLDEGFRWVFLLMAVTWCGDASAYYVGSRIGKTKLTEISPNKTLEGTLGGIVGSIVAACLALPFLPDLCWWHAPVIGLILGVCGAAGDLVESLFKRGAGVKDSSNLIPSHGGIMDKIDSFLFTAPALFYFLSQVVWRV